MLQSEGYGWSVTCSMKNTLLSFLGCAKCGCESLSLHSEAANGTEIYSGELHCESCYATYRISRGVPQIFDHDPVLNITSRAFSDEWRLRRAGFFEANSLFGFTIEQYLEHFRFVFQIECFTSMPSCVVVEAGCGSCEMLQEMARQLPRATFIGIDLSENVVAANQLTHDLPNLHFIRADIQKLPLKNDIADYVFCSGVLHHLANPARGLSELGRLLGAEGKLYCWVYSRNVFCIYDFVRRCLLRPYRLSCRLRVALSYFMAPLIWIFQRATKLYGYKTNGESFPTIAFRLFDNLSPEYQFRYTRSEIDAMCASAGVSWPNFVNELGFVCVKSGKGSR